MKQQSFIMWTTIALFSMLCSANAQNLKPLLKRVDVQSDTASTKSIIDGKWVAIGIKNNYSIQKDYSKLYKGEPSYRFELKQSDNKLEGYSKGETKGRAELSYCYATSKDFQGISRQDYVNMQKMKTVYFRGKGQCLQGSKMHYEFAVFVPKDLSPDVYTIFAQWHGMPDRTLAKTPEGEIKRLSVSEFLEVEKHTIFKKDKGFEKIAVVKQNGDTVYKAGKANGWMIEQGGFPPLAFGFAQGYFYIKTNSDRKWMTDKSDRCNATPLKDEIMVPQKSVYKESTIAYKMPYKKFPKGQWVHFSIDVKWTKYGKESEEILEPGQLNVVMDYMKGKKPMFKTIVDHQTVMIGRNDDQGYYFKFGIYRVAGSTVPVIYNLSGYKECDIH